MSGTADFTTGVFTIPEDVYHADRTSLSVSGAKLLLPPSCPAKFRYAMDNPQEHKAVFDVGHAAHAKVLGVGAPLVVIDADDWRGKAAREARDEAYTAGNVPLLAKDAAHVDGMAEAVLRHPVARLVFDPATGVAEQSLYRIDGPTGTPLRSRLDWLATTESGRMLVADLKTCASAEPSGIGRTLDTFRYHMQAAFYVDMVTGLALAEEAAFVFVFVEKTPPYLVTVAEPDADALRIGRLLNRRAIDLYAACAAADYWPGYSDDEVALIALPRWASAPYDEEYAS